MSAEAIARLREAVRVFDLDSTEHDPIVSFNDLRVLLDAHDAARSEGVAAERTRVVAWLRREGASLASRNAAVDIERGEHEENGNG